MIALILIISNTEHISLGGLNHPLQVLYLLLLPPDDKGQN